MLPADICQTCMAFFVVFFGQMYRAGCWHDKNAFKREDHHQRVENNENKFDTYNNGYLDKWDYGRVQLIISASVDKLIDDAQNELADTDRLSETQAHRIRQKLRGIYTNLIEHPALMERRLYVGSIKPHIPPKDISKRGFDMELAQPVCPSRTEWRLLTRARDLNDTEVEVFQPSFGSNEGQQWFYTVTCNNNALRSKRHCHGCCIGIAHDRYFSSCRQKYSCVMALVRTPYQTHYEWNWIWMDTSCNCAIESKHREWGGGHRIGGSKGNEIRP